MQKIKTPITTTVYKDNTFALDTWDVQSYYADTGACIVVDQVLKPCGGSYRHHIHQWWKVTDEPSTMIVGHIPKNISYRPNEKGCIHSIDFSCNISNIDNAGDVQFGLLVLQHNHVFISKRTFSSIVPGWCYFSMDNLKPTDFKRIDSSVYDLPNFSIIGGEILFGYFTIRTTDQPQFMSVSGIDTWRVTITHEDQDAISNQMKVQQLEHNMTILQQELSDRLSSPTTTKAGQEEIEVLADELTKAKESYQAAMSTIVLQKEALMGAEDKALSLTQEMQKNTAAMQAENSLLRQQLKASSETVFSLKDEIESSSEIFALISKEKETLKQELDQEKEKNRADTELLQSFLNLREAMNKVEAQLSMEQSRRIAIEQELLKQKADGERKEKIYQEEVDANERDLKLEMAQFKQSCQMELDTKVNQINEQINHYKQIVTSQEQEIDRLTTTQNEAYHHVRLSFQDTIENQAKHILGLERQVAKLRSSIDSGRAPSPIVEEDDDDEGYHDIAAHMKDEEDEWEVVQGM